MIAKVKVWLSELSTFVKLVWVFVPVISGAVWLVTVHDTNIIAKSKAEQEQLMDKTDLKKVLVRVDTISRMLRRHIKDQVIASEEVNNKLDFVTGNQANLKRLVTTEFAKTMTPLQVLDMMNFINNEKKKNYLFWIPSSGTQQYFASSMKK